MPILYIDFESNASRNSASDSTIEWSVNQTVGADIFSMFPSTPLANQVGAGSATLYTGGAGPQNGRAVQTAGWPTSVSSDPNTGASRYFQIDSIDASGFQDLTVSFSTRFVAAATTPADISMNVLVSIDNSPYQPLTAITSIAPTLNAANTAWTLYNFTLPSAANGSNNIKLRLYAWRNGAAAYSWRIDNFMVHAGGVTTSKIIPALLQVGNGLKSFNDNVTSRFIPSISSLTIHNSGTILDITDQFRIADTLILNDGELRLSGGDTLIFHTGNAPLVRTNGQLRLNPDSELRFGHPGALGGAAFTLPSTVFATTEIGKLRINRTNAITLGNQGLDVADSLFLNLSGRFITSSANPIRVLNQEIGAVVGGSSTSFVQGLLIRQLETNVTVDGSSYSFPIGDEAGNYRPARLVDIRSGGISPEVGIQVFSTGATTFNPADFNSLRARNWRIEALSGDFTSSALEISNETPPMTTGTHFVGLSDAQSGDYSQVSSVVTGGTQITTAASSLTLSGGVRYAAIGFLSVEPTTPASALIFASITTSSMSVSWTNGNGARRIVVVREGNPVNFVPVDFVNYSSGITNNFITATDRGGGNKIVFNGTGNAFTLLNLTAGLTYHFRVYEYNGELPTETANFLITSFAEAAQGTLPPEPLQNVTNIQFSNITPTAFTISWVIPAFGAGANRIVSVRPFAAIPGNPVDGQAYSANPVFGSGADLSGSGDFVVFNGNGTSVNVTNLNPASRYAVQVFEFNGTGNTSNYLTPGTNADRFTIVTTEPTTHVAGLTATALSKTSVELNWTGIVPSANGYVVAYRPALEVEVFPQDGIVYTNNQVISGDHRAMAAVIPGSVTSTTVTGLQSGTLYFFTVIPFNFDGVNNQTRNYFTGGIPPSVSESTNAPTTYTFVGGTASWIVPTSWTPSGSPSDGDIVVFPGGAATVTDVPTVSIGRLQLQTGGGTLNFQAQNGGATVTLTGSGNASDNAFSIAATRTLTLSGTNATTFVLPDGARGVINGIVTTGSAQPHRLEVLAPSSVTVTGTVNANNNISGSLFSGSVSNAIQFQGGTFQSNNVNSSDPFALTAPLSATAFDNSSLIVFSSNVGAFGSIIQNRSLPIVRINSGAFNQIVNSSGFVSFQSLELVNATQVSLNFTNGITFNDRIQVNAGNLIFSGGTVRFNFGNPGIVEGTGGTITFQAGTTFLVNNAQPITLNRAIRVEGNLSLQNGIINANGLNTITLASTSTVSGGNENSFINGPLRREMASTLPFSFPVGKGTQFRPVILQPATSALSTFSAEFFDTPFGDLTSVVPPLTNVSILNYYEVNRPVGTTPSQVTLSWDGNSGVQNLSDLRVARWNGVGWEENAAASITGTILEGSITTAALNSFGPFTLGSISFDNPLPVEFEDFTFNTMRGKVELLWSTVSEVNNFGFSVMRSELGSEEWESLGFVRGAGTTTQRQSYRFMDRTVTKPSRYQLRQVDFDGTITFSPIVEVAMLAPRQFELRQNYPNPFNPSTTILYDLPEAANVTLTVYDVLGRVVGTLTNRRQEAGTFRLPFNAASFGLASGVYFYRLTAASESKTFVQTKKMILMK